MSTYLEKVDKIETILSNANKDATVKQIKKAKLMGGTGGEILATICSLLKTYEISNPAIFNMIKKPAEELYHYANSVSIFPSANFDLLEELSR